MDPPRSVVLVTVMLFMQLCQSLPVTGITTETSKSTDTLTTPQNTPTLSSDAQTSPKTTSISSSTDTQTTPTAMPVSITIDAQTMTKTTPVSLSSDAQVTPNTTHFSPPVDAQTTPIAITTNAQSTPLTTPISSILPSTHAQTSMNDMNKTTRETTIFTTTPVLPTSTTVEKIFPENSQIIEKLLQAFGEEFLKLLGSLSLKCAVNRFILEYRDLLSNGCNSESLQIVSSTIQDVCADEQTTCSLSQERSEINGIRVCIDSSVRTSPCPEVVVSDQKYCGEFYVYTLNCTVQQQSQSTVAPTTSVTSAAQTATDSSADTSAASYAGAALGGFLGGMLVTALIAFSIHRHRRKMEKQRASLSSNNFPNLKRPLPRIESDVYNKIEDMHEARNWAFNPTRNNQNYDSHFREDETAKKPNTHGQGGMTKCDSCAKGFYTFDPRKSIDEGVLQAPTKYGKLSPVLPRNHSSSHGVDSMGYLTPGKLLAESHVLNCADDGRQANVPDVKRKGSDEDGEVTVASTEQDALGISNKKGVVGNSSGSVHETSPGKEGKPRVKFCIDGAVNEAFEDETVGFDSVGKEAFEKEKKEEVGPDSDIDFEKVISGVHTSNGNEVCHDPDEFSEVVKESGETTKEEEPLYHKLEQFPERVVPEEVSKQEEEVNERFLKEQEISDGK